MTWSVIVLGRNGARDVISYAEGLSEIAMASHVSVMPPSHALLPDIDSSGVKDFAYDEPHSLSAYRLCLHFERQLATTERVRFVRILGYLLPNRTVCEQVVECIHSRKEKNDLTDIGAFFEHHVIVPCEIRYHSVDITQSFVLSSQEVQRSNACTARTPLKTLI